MTATSRTIRILRQSRPLVPRPHLPGAAGSDILSRIRADENLRDVTVILCTADDRQADYLRDQVDFILLKPVSPIQLRQIAARLK